MNTAREMRELTDKYFLERFNQQIDQISAGMRERAEQGYYFYKTRLSHDFCLYLDRTPIKAFLVSLERQGYKVSVHDGADYEIRISWEEC